MGTFHHVQSWPSLSSEMSDAGISIEVTPPEDEEDDDFRPPPSMMRTRRKLSSPMALRPERPPSRSISAIEGTKRRFSTMVNSAAAAAVSRRLSATIGWCLATPICVPTQIIRQGRALCLMYTRMQIRRSSASASCKKIILQRIRNMLETECGVEVAGLHDNGTVVALTALCGAIDRTKPELFRQVARQFTHAPKALLRNETALAGLTLALTKEICKEKITWSKIAAVYCVCGALAREAAEVSESNYEQSIEVVCAPAASLSDLLQEEVGVWVATHGGWCGLLARCQRSQRDRRSERNLYIIITLIMAVCAILTILRLLFPSPALFRHPHD